MDGEKLPFVCRDKRPWWPKDDLSAERCRECPEWECPIQNILDRVSVLEKLSKIDEAEGQ